MSVRVRDVPAFLARLEERGARTAVLRWFDGVPVTPAERAAFRGDVDVLVTETSPGAVAAAVAVDPGPVSVQLRSLNGKLSGYGDLPYYPPELAHCILATRELHPRGFFVPGPRVRLAALLFHLCYHKAEDSGIPTGCEVGTGHGSRDYAAELRAFCDRYAETCPEPLTLTAIEAELRRLDWHLPLDFLTRWPRQSPWIAWLTKRARDLVADNVAALPQLIVLVIRQDLPHRLRARATELMAEHFMVLEEAPLDEDQRARARRGVRGGNWEGRAGGPPAGPDGYALCLPRSHVHGTSGRRPTVMDCKLSIRDTLRHESTKALDGERCRHGLHACDDAFEAHDALVAFLGPDGAARRARELAAATGAAEAPGRLRVRNGRSG